MNKEKTKKVVDAGWKVGDASDVLGLSKEEMFLIDMKISLGSKLKVLRLSSHLTQIEAAKILETSQSRLAKMEAGDPSVSLDLLVKGLVLLGADKKLVGKTIAA